MNASTLNRLEPILALEQRDPVTRFLPYGRQHITDEDITAVVNVLTSDWLTQGPHIEEFESALCRLTGAAFGVACSNATAALHLAMMALDLGPGDTVLTTPVTFLADANCARYVGAEITFADIDPTTGNLSLESVEATLRADTQRKIKAVIAVHLAGRAVDMQSLRAITNRFGVFLIEDACHAIGGSYGTDTQAGVIGSCAFADLTVFSFHPVKHIATGEGGALMTNSRSLADRLRTLRSHGMVRQGLQNVDMALDTDGCTNPWYYEMHEFGYNYRMTDLQAALGTSQLSRLARSVTRRREIAARYRNELAARIAPELLRPLTGKEEAGHAYHLFIVQIDFAQARLNRAAFMHQLREAGIGSQVHYIPIHLQPYYRARYKTGRGDFPNAERYYDQALSLPMYPTLTDYDVTRVVTELTNLLGGSQ